MGDLVVAWYAWLSQLAQGPILVIEGWNNALNRSEERRVGKECRL